MIGEEMKGILEFDLSEPFEASAHKRCISATDAYLALHDIKERLHQLIKNDHDKIKVESLRQDFYDIVDAHGINLDDLD